jgi:hypothetical protein
MTPLEKKLENFKFIPILNVLQAGSSRVQFSMESLTLSFRPYCGSGVDSDYNRNEYQGYLLEGKGGRYVRLTALPP